VSLADYLRGASILDIEENKTGDGIHIRCLLRNLELPKIMSQLKRSKEFDLTGKAALVTGAAGLLGVQHSMTLAEIGARVVVANGLEFVLACVH
jgi:hypothetical protein